MATLSPPLSPAGVPVSFRWAVAIGSAIALGIGFAALTAADVGGQAMLWENAHWTVFYAMAFVLAFRGFRSSGGPERRIRRRSPRYRSLGLPARLHG